MRFIFVLLIILFITGCSKKPDRVVLDTTFGRIVIEVNYVVAPKTSENFVKLVRDGFYDGLTFHRLIPGTLIQGGDPLSKDDDPENEGLG